MKLKKLTITLILTLSLIFWVTLIKADENIYLKIDNLVKNNREKAASFYKALWQIYNYTWDKLWLDKYDFEITDLYWFNLEWLYFNDLTFPNSKNNYEENNFWNDRYIKINFDIYSQITIYKNYKTSDNTIKSIIDNFNNIKTWKTDITKDDFLKKWFLYDWLSFQGYPKYQKLIKNKKWETIWIWYYAFQWQYAPWDFVYYALFVKDNSILIYKTNEITVNDDSYSQLWNRISNTQESEFFIENWKETKFNYDKFYKKYLSKWYFHNEYYLNDSDEIHYKRINEIIKLISDNN